MSDHFFGRGTALSFNVCGLSKHEQNALCAYFRNTSYIRLFAVYRGVVDFEVAGDEHRADLRCDCKRARSRHGVTHFDKFDFKPAQCNGIACRNYDEIALFAVFVQLSFEQSDSERSAVNRHVFEVVRIVWNRADVVFVTVREHDAAKFGYILFYVSDVGDYCIDAGGFLARCEGHAAIDDNHIVAAFDCRHIFAHLADTAEEGHLYCFCIFFHEFYFSE